MLYLKGQPFHIISRAVDEKKIFDNDADCYRFIFQMYAANVGKPNFNTRRLDIVKAAKALLRGEEISNDVIIEEHPPLVHFLDFSLNVTHYHFHLISSKDGNIPIFIKKLNIGFAKFFNLKYGRKGSLFGSRYKGIPIKTDFQSDAVSRYVSVVNPLDIHQPSWRENGLLNPEKAREFLESYEFSSFLDRIGKRHSKILAAEEILREYSLVQIPSGDYEKLVQDFLNQKIAYRGYSEMFNIVS